MQEYDFGHCQHGGEEEESKPTYMESPYMGDPYMGYPNMCYPYMYYPYMWYPYMGCLQMCGNYGYPYQYGYSSYGYPYGFMPPFFF